jgi:hypothetical protein
MEKRFIMAVLSLSVASRAIPRLALLHLCTHIPHPQSHCAHLPSNVTEESKIPLIILVQSSFQAVVGCAFFLPFLQFYSLESSRACLSLTVDTYGRLPRAPLRDSPWDPPNLAVVTHKVELVLLCFYLPLLLIF